MKSTVAIVVAAALLLFAPIVRAGTDDNSPDVVLTPEFVRTHSVDVLLSRVLSASDAKELDVFDALIGEIQSSPTTASDEPYSLVATRICEALTSTDFGPNQDTRRQTLIEKCALAALASHPQMPPAAKAYFTTRPLLSDALLTGPAWETRRAARVDAFIAVLRTATPTPGSIESKPVVNPQGGKPIVEVKAYVTTLDKQQHDDREMEAKSRSQMAARYYENATESFLMSAYSRPPFNLTELRTKVKASGMPKDVQWRILGKVIYAMRLAGAPVDAN